MSWKTLEPERPDTPLFWWVWRDKLGETLEGYWGGLHIYESEKNSPDEIVKVLLVYDDTTKTWYRAFVSGGLKRFPLKDIPEGARVKIKAYKENDRIRFSVSYNEEEKLLPLDYPEEYLSVDLS